jgi:hypothetical protein
MQACQAAQFQTSRLGGFCILLVRGQNFLCVSFQSVCHAANLNEAFGAAVNLRFEGA